MKTADWIVLTRKHGSYNFNSTTWAINEGVLYIYRYNEVVAAYPKWVYIREKEPVK